MYIEKKNNYGKKYQEILFLVKKERERRGVKETELKSNYDSFEFSCNSHGEAFTLVERYLIYGNENLHPMWEAVRKDSVLQELAYNYLKFGSREGREI